MPKNLASSNPSIRKNFGLDPDSKRPVVCVQGLGFVGAAMAVAVACAKHENGEKIFDVLGVDICSESGTKRIESINHGRFPFSSGDEALEKATKECRFSGNLAATHDPTAFELADVVVVDINLDIDFNQRPPSATFGNFISALETIGNHIQPRTLVIIETTVPPGTCANIALPTLQKAFAKRDLAPSDALLAHSYERVMPGPDYLNSIINYWRVYAGINEISADLCRVFLEKIIDTKNFPLRQLSSTTASETAKIMENTYRAVNIALIDEWGVFAENVGIDVFEIIDAIRDRPTHNNMRQPGFGVGGYCLTKDPYFGQIANSSFFQKQKIAFPFANLAMATNKEMPERNLRRILDLSEKNPSEINMLLLGVAYRSEVDDTRFSAAEIFYRKSTEMGISVEVQDPHVQYWDELDILVHKTLPNLENFDVIAFLVPHKYYQNLDFKTLPFNINSVIYDCDRVLTTSQISDLKTLNANYFSTGRGI